MCTTSNPITKSNISQSTTRLCIGCQWSPPQHCGSCPCCRGRAPVAANSFRTEVTTPDGAIHLCQWFSLNERPLAERREIAADLGIVILAEVCKPAMFAAAPVAVKNTPWQGPDVAKMEAGFVTAFCQAVA